MRKNRHDGRRPDSRDMFLRSHSKANSVQRMQERQVL